MFDQNYLDHYFENVWEPQTNEYQYTGWALVDKVQENEWVLDVGCGYNPYRGRIKNLVGIDPAIREADILTTIEDYTPDRLFDVAFVLGSIGFGLDRSVIEKQIEKIVSCLKQQSRIYWRLNPGRNDHPSTKFNSVTVYPWTLEDNAKFAQQFGYRVADSKIDPNTRGNRFYVEWIRN